MDYNRLMDKANDRVKGLNQGIEFVLRDLFEGVEWEKLTKGERIQFGKRFRNEVGEGIIENVTCLGKAQNNSTKYKKI